ncbi:hypothetical protein CsatB_014924 [Cannabis sativa]
MSVLSSYIDSFSHFLSPHPAADQLLFTSTRTTPHSISLLFILAGFIDHHQNLEKKKLMAETILSPVIEKLIELLAQKVNLL